MLVLYSFITYGQENQRLQNIKNNLELLAQENKGLTEGLKIDINVANVTLSNFLLAVSKVHKVNLNVAPELSSITLVNNFSNVTVADLLVFLVKEYNLDIDFTGNILSIKKYQPALIPIPKKEIPIVYDALQDVVSIDLKNDLLYDAFRTIMDKTGKNLVFSPEIEGKQLTAYITGSAFDSAMDKLAFANNLHVSKTKDGFYLFENNGPNLTSNTNNTNVNNVQRQRPARKSSNFYYRVLDTVNKIVAVDFENIPIKDIINDIGTDLHINVFTAKPLDEAGTASLKAKYIAFDDLLDNIFESQGIAIPPTPNNGINNNPSRPGAPVTTSGVFTYKKEGNMYFFGTSDQLSVRKIEVIQLMHRSVELLGDPSGSGTIRSAGRTAQGAINYIGGPQNNTNNPGFSNNFNNPRVNTTTTSRGFNSNESKGEALVNILPDDVIGNLDIKMDFELNSFLVSGPATDVNRFKAFIEQIDKPVPVILIEVMLLEVSRSSTVETGISWGIGDEPVETRGRLFPDTDITLGAETVNKIIGGFDGFGSINVGRVVPEFFATIKAMEANGNIKVRSTPKLSTLNGHRATLSIGETTYYVVTSQNFFGSQIPQSSEIRNFQPIDAELAVSIKPLVSGDGQITLDINVIQSDFNGERIDEEAPPGLTSREFNSIIRVRDQDLAVLGGLEEKVKNDSGTGVPLLSRIPIIKWFFSTRKREDSKKKLTILIKPTVIY
ncbi:hypothetical protein [Leptobacterium sp. I13]|uniref:type II secretion system protein GspD n=1 Tax=Leptobacterium meishanense TaxID=3128904 RepID=UPI0030EDF688